MFTTDITDITDVETFDFFAQMKDSIHVFATGGHEFVVQTIDHFDVNINKIKPIRGNRYIAAPTASFGNHFIPNV